uniref:Uncharacterized protein n=1 Tax=Octactis speculum TaxID=3111310 RepID=A0A7S2DH34_9STRA
MTTKVWGVRYCPHPRDVDEDANQAMIGRTEGRSTVHREWSAPWLMAGSWVYSRSIRATKSQSSSLESDDTPIVAPVSPSCRDGNTTICPFSKNALPWFDGVTWRVGF